MARIRRAQTALAAFVLFALLAATSMTFSAGSASADLLEEVTGPLQETVGAPVEEVTETVAPPVQEVTETVTRPVQQAAGALAPPAQAVTKVVTSPPVTSGKVPVVPVVQAPADQSRPPSSDPVESVGTVVREATGIATQAAQGAVGAVTDAALPDSASADRDGAGTSAAVPSQRTESGHPNPTSAEPDLGPGDDTFEAPSNDGSVRAPFDRWLAYVWPAALTGPKVASLLEHWEQRSLRLASTGSAGEAASGGSEGPVVDGVHASGGRPEASKSSSLFSRIPSALDHFPQSVPTSALAYLLVVAAMVLAVLAAIRWEIVHHRRQGRP